MAKAARKGASDTEVMSAAYGAIVVNDTSEKECDCDMIVSLDDTTIVSSLKINGAGANVVADYITTPGTAFPKGGILTAEDGSYFSAITLSTAGAVNLEKKKPV